MKENLSTDWNSYLMRFKKRYSKEYLFDVLEAMKDTRVLVVGEAILDEYTFGRSIGKSAKEPIVALKEIKKELYAGGSIAIANHLASFCKEVTLFAMLGEENSQEAFVRRSLPKNVKPVFFYKKSAPTIMKKRFMEEVPLQKLLEFYVMSDKSPSASESAEVVRTLRKLFKSHDLVICGDFGHGMLDRASRKELMQRSPFLALTAQANAGNMGFHTLSVFPKADYVCADERELRLEARERNHDLISVMRNVATKLRYKNFIVTGGPMGCYLYNRGKITNAPTMRSSFTDRMGAGDAFLALTAPLVHNRVPLDVVGFIGNAVGALAIGIVGNKRPIKKAELKDFISELLA